MINLLPPSYKEEIVKEEKWKMVLIMEFLLSIFLISLILILFSVRIYIKGQVEALKISASLEEKNLQALGIQTLREKTGVTNQKILKLESFYKNQTDSMELLEKIFKTLPSETNLAVFYWQKSISQVSLSGFSSSRANLFELKKNLEAEQEFSDIYFPSQNWVSPTDIDFQVTFKLKR
jgi:Tfp pilus assembly protein PilO